MDDRDREQLDAVVAVVFRALGDGVVGVYQYGSSVMGGLRPLSDLDVLVVVDRPTSATQRKQLATELMAVSGSRGAGRARRPVELTVLRDSLVDPWPERPQQEFQYGEWLRGEYEAGHVPEPETDHDLAPLVATLLAASTALFGPPAESVFTPIPHEKLVASMQESIPSLMRELDTDTVNVLLTLARMWHTKATGLVATKDAAASWAIERLPAELRRSLELARAVYVGDLEASLEQVSKATPTAQYLRAVVCDELPTSRDGAE